MKISLNWLNKYLSQEVDRYQLEKDYNLKSQEVSGLYPLVEASNLVIGYVKSCVQHENADKLKVCQVDVGDEVLQIICGAPNVDQGQKVIVACPGAVLPGNFKIKKAKIRGVVSNGMICSLAELGVQDFDKNELGIYVLKDDAPIGQDPLKFMGLDDWILDLDLTANRPDLLSMRGIAYDVKAMMDVDIEFTKPLVNRSKSKQTLNISTQTDDAPVYYGQIINNIQVKDSPYWLKSRLLSSGIRPINNVVDITNYVMLEYGQPLHAFDYNKFDSDQIIVRKAYDNETIVTLDDIERKLQTSDIVITDGQKPIALAGVMGGNDTEVDATTQTILLESAVFDPVSVRKTSRRLALKSESSSRFEKGINHTLTKEAMDRACELFVQLADGVVEGQASGYHHIDTQEQHISLSIKQLNRVTGHTFDVDTIKDLLRRLDYHYQVKDQVFDIEIPPRCIHFESYQDVIEEIVRIYGYDRIGTTLPTTPTEGKLSPDQAFKRQLRQYFTSIGFFETNTYSLTNQQQARQYDASPYSLVEIMNPINKERAFLRHSTIPALTDVMAYNVARKLEDIFIFEIGKRYTKESETELLSGLMHGTYQYSHWQKKTMQVDFYLLKGIIESFMTSMHIDHVEFKRAQVERPHIHPGISADIFINKVRAGWLGKLHPEEEKRLDVQDVYVFEMDLPILLKAAREINRQYQPMSKYPSVSRDIALVVDEDIEASILIETVKAISSQFLKSASIFDVYQGEHLEEGKKSIAMALVFENKEKTLETDEVDQMVQDIIKALEKEHQAQLRQ